MRRREKKRWKMTENFALYNKAAKKLIELPTYLS